MIVDRGAGQVLFAFCVALTLSRRGAEIGVFRTIFYLPTLAPPVAATLGFVFLFNPRPGRSTAILGCSASPQPLWFDDPSWPSRRSRCCGMWGVGTMMIIFLAACSTCRRHLYEAAELDGAGRRGSACATSRCPTISPVILFAVVTGVIDALQYFTQGYVAATIAAGRRRRRRRREQPRLSGGLDAVLSGLLYQQGFQYFNMGYASAMAVLLFVVAFAVTVLIVRARAAGCTTRGGR